ncbi:hypothetical protein HRbin05_00309 [archaeon HR05]|nr:hypothetical protein HRbin05_00309 [archaeon HR05]
MIAKVMHTGGGSQAWPKMLAVDARDLSSCDVIG